MASVAQSPETSDFRTRSAAAAHDAQLQAAIENAVMRQHRGREAAMGLLPDAQGLRDLAGKIKEHTLENLDYYLGQLTSAVRAAGGQVHVAASAQDVHRIVLGIAAQKKCKLCTKTKSMATEEVNLTASLEAGGMEVVETDLGEFIVQISHDRPSHLVCPTVHKSKESIARLFADYFGTPHEDDPEALTMQARRHLREKFRRADMGITGGNFLVAQTGQVCIVTNEGNGRLCTTLPRVLVSVVGIEKLVPRLADLAVMLKLLGRSSTGQAMTVYTSLFGPRRPQRFHLVLLDNGRRRILDSPYRQILRCIRCGACLNSCPVYRKIGGHVYGGVYPGPIGALLTPLLGGLEEFSELPQACSLCGACAAACPVTIDLPALFIRMREEIVGRKLPRRTERLTYALWAAIAGRPHLYRWMTRFQKWLLGRRAIGGWVTKLPRPAAGWSETRDLPSPAGQTFAQLWKDRQ